MVFSEQRRLSPGDFNGGGESRRVSRSRQHGGSHGEQPSEGGIFGRRLEPDRIEGAAAAREGGRLGGQSAAGGREVGRRDHDARGRARRARSPPRPGGRRSVDRKSTRL